MAGDQQGAGSVYRLRLVARRDIAALDHPASRQQIARLGVGSSRKRANPQVRREWWLPAAIVMTALSGIFSASGGKTLRTLVLSIGILSTAAQPAGAEDLDDWTVVTLARDGSWGVAIASTQGQALAAAIRDCNEMAAALTDCGAQFVTTRGGWVVANLCRDHKIIVAAGTREVAEQLALFREIDLKELYVPDLPPCSRVLTVDPRGTAVPGQATSQRHVEVQRRR
jgi:hypothetical protein